MAVPKKVAMICFYACSSAFTALSVYGAALYLGEVPSGQSLASTALYGGGVLGSLVGLCWFGSQWDARRREEHRPAAAPESRPKKRLRK